MKRLVVVLSSLLVLPAFAEVAPQYDTDITFSDVELNNVDTGEVESAVAEVATEDAKAPKQQATGRTLGTGSRVASAGRTATSRNSGTASRTNTTRSRSVSVRSTATPVRTTSVSTRRANTNQARAGTTARAATLNTTANVYNPVVQSRTPRASVVTTRGATMRVATTGSSNVTPTAETVVETTSELDAIKSLTEACQAQYAACMDNYCNVLDDNQGRCTCSKNITNYEKTEAALESATEALQDVARNIQYIGLTSDQISTLFTETEAELSMKNAKDSSAIRSSLDKVKRMVVDVKSGTASATATSGNAMSFDLSGLLNFDMGDFGFDLTSFMNTTSNTSSISNQRGESLYKTAVARCKASVLNSCTAQGVDAAVVTNSYDLEIDKSCLAYERALTESNTQMTQTVANAKEVLKKARLMVAQNKNSYDLRGCVSALESCMQDDYVCGNGYEGCLDPTGQYIVNGSVVIGSLPGNNTDTTTSTYSHDNLFETWKVNGSTPWDGNTTLVEYIEDTVTSTAAKTSSDKMSAYLQNKIGYHDDKNNKDYGMCMSVLNQCQNYTYNSKTSKYDPTNEVIKQFLARALVQIKLAQDELLASYAQDCVSDVSSCLTSNNYDESNPTGTKSRAAINSCYSQIKTCMSVNGNVYGSIQPEALRTWVTGIYSSIEIYQSTEAIDQACSVLTEESDCKAARGYCDNGNSVTALNNGGAMCQWNSGTCSTASGVACTAASN